MPGIGRLRLLPSPQMVDPSRRTVLAAALAGALPAARRISVWPAGEGGYHTFRIPAVVRTRGGALLAFCEGRRDGQGDSGNIDLLLKRGSRFGDSWSAIQTIADFASDTIGNPAPVVDRRNNQVHLLLTRNPGSVREKEILAGAAPGTRTVWITSSADEGRTWTPPRDITSDVKDPAWRWYATGPGNGIQLRGGRLLIPCDHSRADGRFWSHVIYSDDGGLTWRPGGSAGPDCNECAIAESPDGSLILNMRSYHGKLRRAVSRSRDGGLTWSEPMLDESLIEPVCQASLIRAGRQLLFANPASARRENLTVKASRDGRTWNTLGVIHAGPAAYSCLVDLGGKRAGLLWECGEASPYERIDWTVFPYS